MADKRIVDFATLEQAQDDDLLLVASEGETYNVRFRTLKEYVAGSTQRAEEAAARARELVEAAKQEINRANSTVNSAAAEARTAAENANEKAQAAARATELLNEALRVAGEATRAAGEAAGAALAAKAEAERAVEAAERATSENQEATTASRQATQEARTAKENADNAALQAQRQANYAKDLGDLAAGIIDEIRGIEAGNVAADLTEIKKHKIRVISVKERDPSKPTYGIGEDPEELTGEESYAIELAPFSEDASAVVSISGELYSATNIGFSGESHPDGTIIITESEE